MSDSIKEKISGDLEKAKAEGGVRTDRIKGIVREAVMQALGELKEGSGEIRSIARSVISTVADDVKGKGQDATEEIRASIEGLVEGIGAKRRELISQTQTEVDQLQAQIDHEEQQLQTEIEGALTEVETSGKQSSADVKVAIDSAVQNFKDSESFAVMQQQYAKLKAKLAVLDANLAARYGERYDDVKKHLDTAKTWYDDAKVRVEAGEPNPIEQKQAEFEHKLSEAGAAIAQREKRVKQLLKELWHSVTNL